MSRVICKYVYSTSIFLSSVFLAFAKENYAHTHSYIYSDEQKATLIAYTTTHDKHYKLSLCSFFHIHICTKEHMDKSHTHSKTSNDETLKGFRHIRRPCMAASNRGQSRCSRCHAHILFWSLRWLTASYMVYITPTKHPTLLLWRRLKIQRVWKKGRMIQRA